MYKCVGPRVIMVTDRATADSNNFSVAITPLTLWTERERIF